jgi:propionaldehyde dehydrogenase
MKDAGAYQITRQQADALAKIVLVDKKNPKTGVVNKIVNRDCVGRDAAVLLEKIGVRVDANIRCIICETDFQHPFVQHELMMPILPIVRVNNIDEAIELAVKAEHGCRHTAHMHSKNIDHLTRFARAVETTIFVKNAPSYAGIGFGGEGHTTFTIAGPTGEGLTSARSFTRYRRCVLSESFRII